MLTLDLTNSPFAGEKPSHFRTLTILAMVLSGLALSWGVVDTRMVDGSPVWMKPLKFSISFVIMFGTIELVRNRISEPIRNGWTFTAIAFVMTAAFLAEMAYMFFQAAQGEASHFNNATPFHAFMYVAVMGSGAVALVACVGIVGWLVKSDREARFSPALREAIWLGFLLSFVLTMIVAGYMSAGAESRHVGVHPEGAPELFLLGWSGVTGDLRPAHFLSLHAMQALPLLALWMERKTIPASVTTIRLFAAGYAAITLGVFWVALAGLPLIPLS